MRALPVAVLWLALAGCDGLEGELGGGGGRGGQDPEDLRPLLCRVEAGVECSACLVDCCSPCEVPDSECRRYASCALACPAGDIDCKSTCEETFWEGLLEMLQADECVYVDCGEICSLR